MWCCHASTPGASAAGLAVDAAWDTHCQFRCAHPFCTQSSALHSMHLRKRKPHLQFPTIGLLMCLHVLLSPGHSSQGSWPTTDFLGLSETLHSEVPQAQRHLSMKKTQKTFATYLKLKNGKGNITAVTDWSKGNDTDQKVPRQHLILRNVLMKKSKCCTKKPVQLLSMTWEIPIRSQNFMPSLQIMRQICVLFRSWHYFYSIRVFPFFPKNDSLPFR